MARVTNKPAIEQVRDQVDIDAATTEHLGIVTQNIGFLRPALFWSDDEVYRAVARGAALNLKVVKNAIARVLLNVAGPRTTQIGYMYSQTIIPNMKPSEDEFTVDDRTGWPQVGVLTFDPQAVGVPFVEEELAFGFVDPATNNVIFRATATETHIEHLPWASSRMSRDHRAGELSIALDSIANLPTIPATNRFAVWVGRGTAAERIHEVTATAGSTLTISVPLEFDYDEDTVVMLAFMTEAPTLVGAHAVGSNSLTVSDGRFFQTTPNGLYIINRGNATEEWVTCNGWTAAPNQVALDVPTVTALDHAAGETVEYVQILVEGCAWDIFETQPRKVTIRIPDTCRFADFGQGSYLHEQLDAPGAASAPVGAFTAGDLYLTIPHAVNWEIMLGLTSVTHPTDPVHPMRVIYLDDGVAEETKVVSRLSRARLATTANTADTTLVVDNWRPIQDAIDHLALPFNAVLDRGNPNVELVAVTALDQSTSTVTLAAPLAPGTGMHLEGVWLEPRTDIVFFLSAALQNSYGVATSIVRQQTMYTPAVYPPGPAPGSADLQNGNRNFTPGDTEDSYPGYYIPGGLTYDIAGQQPTRFWNGVVPHPVDAQALNIIPAQQVLSAAHLAGVIVLNMDNVTHYPFIGQAPYQVRLNPGQPNEEDVTVLSKGINLLNLDPTTPLVNDHAQNEPVVLLVEKLALASSFGFGTSGAAWIDYGFETAEYVEYQSINGTILEFSPPVMFQYQHPAGLFPASMTLQPTTSIVNVAHENTAYDTENQQRPFYIFGAGIEEMLVGEFGILEQIKAAGIEIEVLVVDF